MNSAGQQSEFQIAIIGAGISGLSSAYFVAKKSRGNIKSITIFEKNSKIGGVLNCTEEKGYLFEHGAQGVLLSRKSFSSLLTELNISDKILIPEKKNSARYLLTKNSFVSLSPLQLLKANLLSFKDILRILAEFFVKSPKPSGSDYRTEDPDVTLYAFFARRFGKKFADLFIIPLSFGIWGGGSKRLLMRYAFPELFSKIHGYGSVLRFLLQTTLKNFFYKKKTKKGLASFEHGMNFLIQSLFQDLQNICKSKGIALYLKTDTEVKSLAKENFKIRIEFKPSTQMRTPQKPAPDEALRARVDAMGALAHEKTESKQEQSMGPVFEVFDCAVYAGQPWRNMPLHIETTSEEAQKALRILQNIPSHSIAVVGLGGKKIAHIPHTREIIAKGFGGLAGKDSPDLLGVLFVHSIYPQHAPKDSFLYRVLLGGDRDPDICKKTDEELILLAKNRLIEATLLNKETQFNFQNIIKWDKYIPLATELQNDVLKSIWKLEVLFPELFITGNYIKSPSVADCIEQAQIAANKLLCYLNNRLLPYKSDDL